jgi:hypothetical protein
MPSVTKAPILSPSASVSGALCVRTKNGTPSGWLPPHSPAISKVRLPVTITPMFGEHLFRRRRPVGPDDGALDGDVPVREPLALDREAQHARLLDEPRLSGLATLGTVKMVTLLPGW